MLVDPADLVDPTDLAPADAARISFNARQNAQRLKPSPSLADQPDASAGSYGAGAAAPVSPAVPAPPTAVAAP